VLGVFGLWWRKIQALGLSPEFKDKTSEIGSILKMFFGLPLLPPYQVVDCYVEDLFALKPESKQQLIEFFDYICANYFDDGHFPPEMWADMSSTSDRTTNCCESFHAKFNAEFTSAHPNIFNFMEILKQIQADTYIKLRSKNIRKKTNNQQMICSVIQKCIDQFKEGQITRAEYVKKVSFKFKPQVI
jgi:hypothetical protein